MTKINGIEQTPQQMVTRLKKELKELEYTLKNCDYLNGGSQAQLEIPHVSKELKYNQNLVKMQKLRDKLNVTRNAVAYDKLSDKIERLRQENNNLI